MWWLTRHSPAPTRRGGSRVPSVRIHIQDSRGCTAAPRARSPGGAAFQTVEGLFFARGFSFRSCRHWRFMWLTSSGREQRRLSTKMWRSNAHGVSARQCIALYILFSVSCGWVDLHQQRGSGMMVESISTEALHHFRRNNVMEKRVSPGLHAELLDICLLYTSPSPRDRG